MLLNALSISCLLHPLIEAFRGRLVSCTLANLVPSNLSVYFKRLLSPLRFTSCRIAFTASSTPLLPDSSLLRMASMIFVKLFSFVENILIVATLYKRQGARGKIFLLLIPICIQDDTYFFVIPEVFNRE